MTESFNPGTLTRGGLINVEQPRIEQSNVKSRGHSRLDFVHLPMPGHSSIRFPLESRSPRLRRAMTTATRKPRQFPLRAAIRPSLLFASKFWFPFSFEWRRCDEDGAHSFVLFSLYFHAESRKKGVYGVSRARKGCLKGCLLLHVPFSSFQGAFCGKTRGMAWHGKLLDYIIFFKREESQGLSIAKNF